MYSVFYEDLQGDWHTLQSDFSTREEAEKWAVEIDLATLLPDLADAEGFVKPPDTLFDRDEIIKLKRLCIDNSRYYTCHSR
jgi:hypothetical protein